MCTQSSVKAPKFEKRKKNITTLLDLSLLFIILDRYWGCHNIFAFDAIIYVKTECLQT